MPWSRGQFPFPILDSCIEVDSSQGFLTGRLYWELGWLQFPSQMCLADAPKLQGPVAVYTWEGNQVNITCEVFAYPSAVISWFRDGQLLPSSNYSNIKIYNTPSASYLEVRKSHECLQISGDEGVQSGPLGRNEVGEVFLACKF